LLLPGDRASFPRRPAHYSTIGIDRKERVGCSGHLDLVLTAVQGRMHEAGLVGLASASWHPTRPDSRPDATALAGDRRRNGRISWSTGGLHEPHTW
jgi:hypothetical protein